MNEDLSKRMAEVISNEFEIDRAAFVPEASIKDHLRIDSLDVVDLVVLIESEFGVKLQANDFAQAKTWQDVVDRVAERL